MGVTYVISTEITFHEAIKRAVNLLSLNVSTDPEGLVNFFVSREFVIVRNSELPVVSLVITLAFTISPFRYRLPPLLQYAPYYTSLQNECRKTQE